MPPEPTEEGLGGGPLRLCWEEIGRDLLVHGAAEASEGVRRPERGMSRGGLGIAHEHTGNPTPERFDEGPTAGQGQGRVEPLEWLKRAVVSAETVSEPDPVQIQSGRDLRIPWPNEGAPGSARDEESALVPGPTERKDGTAKEEGVAKCPRPGDEDAHGRNQGRETWAIDALPRLSKARMAIVCRAAARPSAATTKSYASDRASAIPSSG